MMEVIAEVFHIDLMENCCYTIFNLQIFFSITFLISTCNIWEIAK